MQPEVNQQQAAIARASRRAQTNPSPEATRRLEDARRDYYEAKLERHIRAVVDKAPPLTVEQRKRLAAILLHGAA